MPVKKELPEPGLNRGERVTVQKIFESFQCGTHTREDIILRILNLLFGRGSTDDKVWKDLTDTMEGLKFDSYDAAKFLVTIHDSYQIIRQNDSYQVIRQN